MRKLINSLKFLHSAKSCLERPYSTHTHAHSCTPGTQEQLLPVHNLIYSLPKQITNRDFRYGKIVAWSKKHGRSVFFGKRNVFRLSLKELRWGFCQRGSGRLFHTKWPKTEKAQK